MRQRRSGACLALVFQNDIDGLAVDLHRLLPPQAVGLAWLAISTHSAHDAVSQPLLKRLAWVVPRVLPICHDGHGCRQSNKTLSKVHRKAMLSQQTACNAITAPGCRCLPACTQGIVTTCRRTAFSAHLGQQRCRQARCRACGAAQRPGRRCLATTHLSGARRACATVWLWVARAGPLPGTPLRSPR